MAEGLVSHSGFDVLEALHQHRYLTIGQLRRFMLDTSRGSGGGGTTYNTLNALKRQGLVKGEPVEGHGLNVWFLTDAGREAIPKKRRRDYAATAAQAAGLDHRHSWSVNEVALAFFETARRRDDECGVLALEHEVKLRDTGTLGSLIIADGVLQYVELGPGAGHKVHTAVIEVDRKTSPGRIANRLRAYAEIKRKRALWTKILPDGWPPVLFVVSDDPTAGPRAGERYWAGDPKRSVARCARLSAYVGKLGKAESALGALDVLFAPLPALIAQGPYAAIWRRPGHPEPVDWLGKPVMIMRKGGVA